MMPSLPANRQSQEQTYYLVALQARKRVARGKRRAPPLVMERIFNPRPVRAQRSYQTYLSSYSIPLSFSSSRYSS